MTPLSPVSIRLRQCAKTFGDGSRALDPIDLEIAAGESLVLLGPSGCGKTTTLRLIAGLETPDAGGQVLFDGADVTRQPIERRHIGMVFQSYALFPNMSVAGNIGYGLRLRRLPQAEQQARVGEMLEMMRLSPLADRHIDQLSGGQRQRVALARALAVRPRALLLDEPLTALDAKLRETLRVEIDSLLRELGITTIHVTHDQAEAMALGDRIVVMDHGRIAQVGTPREIYQRPANRFVADFIGAMNRITGRVRDGGFACGSGHLPELPGHLDHQRLAGGGELLFRPEDARVSGDGEAPHLTGTLATVFFLGDRTRLFVDVGESQPVMLETAARRDFRRGESIGIHIDPAGLMQLEGTPC